MLCTVLQEGAARRVGEQSEHVWSLTKPFSKLARYSTRAAWQDGFNLLLELLTLLRLLSFPTLLKQKWDSTVKKKGEM